MSTITYPHIEIDADGLARISGTTTKVVEIVQDHLAHHWHAEDICRQYPYLSPAKWLTEVRRESETEIAFR